MSSVTDFFPVGAVISMAGTLPEEMKWLLCDGREFSIDDYPQLFEIIQFAYGGNEEDKIFAVPDYRGRFLRGTSYDSGIDPDVDSRINLGLAEEGETLTGNAVGTVQEYATKRPDNSFEASVPHLSTSNYRTHGETDSSYSGDNGSETINTCTRGGDGDTRPVNIYVNFYIKAAE